MSRSLWEVVDERQKNSSRFNMIYEIVAVLFAFLFIPFVIAIPIQNLTTIPWWLTSILVGCVIQYAGHKISIK